jgi:hypothetical protein
MRAADEARVRMLAPRPGRYRTLVLDPPWAYDDSIAGRAKPSYATMTQEQLLALDAAQWAEDNCHLYLWTTNSFMHCAFELMAHWGFTHKTILTWNKQRLGLGAQTLLTSLNASQNVERLHWLMSRLQGYVGLANYMGGRFTATETALAPVLREAAKRGLIYVEDGASPRSLAGQMATANNLPYAKADLMIDAVPTAAEIDRSLARLEKTARDHGVAFGMANALPASIERIAAWAKTAESRGIVLVPISAIAARGKSS